MHLITCSVCKTKILFNSTAVQGTIYIPVPVANNIINGANPINNNNDHEGNLRPPSPDVPKLSQYLPNIPTFYRQRWKLKKVKKCLK